MSAHAADAHPHGTLPLPGLAGQYGHPMPTQQPTGDQDRACALVRTAQLAVLTAERALADARWARDRVVIAQRDHLAELGWRASERAIGAADGALLLSHTTLLNIVRHTNRPPI